jgi:hypothetical protein
MSRASSLWLKPASSRAFFNLFTACRLLHTAFSCQSYVCGILHALLSLAIPNSYVGADVSVIVVQTKEVVRRRIALLLAEREIKKQGFAKAAKRSPSWVPMFLRGERPFPFERIDEVALFFQHTPEAFIAPLTDDEVTRSDGAFKQLRRQHRRRAGQHVLKRARAS